MSNQTIQSEIINKQVVKSDAYVTNHGEMANLARDFWVKNLASVHQAKDTLIYAPAT